MQKANSNINYIIHGIEEGRMHIVINGRILGKIEELKGQGRKSTN